jgi:choice-of-anchor A domain-containing protein
MNPVQRSLFLLAVCAAVSAEAQSFLSQYDVIVSGELRNVSEFEGPGVINTITSGNTFNTAFKLPSNTPQNSDTVYVQTALNRSISIQQGSLYYAGSQTVQQNANQFFVGGNIINIQGYNQGATIHKPGSFSFSSVFNGISNESTTYSGYTANSTASISGNNLTFKIGTLPSSQQAVFTINKSLLETANLSQINLDLSGTTPKSIIINVTGASGYSLSTPGGVNFVGNFANKANSTKVLWNFGSATAINFQQSWYGSILAPFATLKDTGGALEGSVGVKNLDASVEVHYPLWVGPSVAVPETSTYAAVAGLGLLTFAAIRRAKRQ